MGSKAGVMQGLGVWGTVLWLGGASCPRRGICCRIGAVWPSILAIGRNPRTHELQPTNPRTPTRTILCVCACVWLSVRPARNVRDRAISVSAGYGACAFVGAGFVGAGREHLGVKDAARDLRACLLG